MLKLSSFSKNKKSVKSIKSVVTQQYDFPNVHTIHNNFKSGIGKFLGIPTYTIADNESFIKELVEWKNSDREIEKKYEKSITEFIEMNNVHQKTTVFFEKHWKYRMCTIGLPLLYVDYKYMNSGTYFKYSSWSDIIGFGIVCMNLCSLVALPIPETQTLTYVAMTKRTLKNVMESNKIINQYQKKNDDKSKNIE